MLQIFQHGSINKQVVFIRTTGRSCILNYECGIKQLIQAFLILSSVNNNLHRDRGNNYVMRSHHNDRFEQR